MRKHLTVLLIISILVKSHQSELQHINILKSDILVIKETGKDYPGDKEISWINLSISKKLEIKEDSTYVFSRRAIKLFTLGKVNRTLIINAYYRSKREDCRIDFAFTVTGKGEAHNLLDGAEEDISVFSHIPAYENLYKKKITIEELNKGDILDYKITTTGKINPSNPFILDETMGDEGATVRATVEIIIPRDFNITFQQHMAEEPDLIRKEDKKIYRWNLKNIPPVFNNINILPVAYLLPRITAGLSGDWEVLVDEFRKHMKGSFTPEGRKPEDIYEEVMKLIKYVEIPSCTYSPFPRNAFIVNENRIANSLDKAHFLFQAFRNAGYPVEMILVRSRKRGPVFERVPSLYQFDGALIKTGDVILDPSSESIPYGYIRPEYQGTRGLSIMRKRMVSIPLLKPETEK